MRLDEIKARWEKAKPPWGSSDAVRTAAQDIPALVAAVEAVLKMPPYVDSTATLNDFQEGYNYAIEVATNAIRTALGEEQ